MAKLFFTSLLFSILQITLIAQQTPKVFTPAEYAFAEKQLAAHTSKLVYRSGVNPQWLSDGRMWYSVNTPEGEIYVMVDLAAGKKTELPNKEALPKEASTTSNPQRSRSLEIASPDGKQAVYIKDWNLWIKDVATGKEWQLTTDGTENFGYATDNAGWAHTARPVVKWSPDSKKIATFQQDERLVNDMYLVKTKVSTPELEKWKYPLAGDKEVVKIHRVIIDLEQNKVIRLQMEADAHRSTLGDDVKYGGSFADNEWSADGSTLAFVSTTRDHKQATLRIANATTGEVRTVHTEKVATQYESGQTGINWRYLPNRNAFIWYSEQDDWGHLYLHDLTTGKLKNRITTGNFVVSQIWHIDEEKGIVYFEGKGKEAGRNPYFGHLYKVGLDGKGLTLLTPENANHQISFSPDYKYFVDNYSQPDVPTVSVLRNIDGKMLATLETADITKLKASGWIAPQPITVKSADGHWDLYGLMFSPPNKEPGKKYPVINYVYPGPQGGSMGSRSAAWSFAASNRDNQALAALGFVVVVIEGTCNPNRSKSFHDACYGSLAVNTLPDQIAGILQLAAQHNFIDLDRVGIWGHSGGGSATTAAMFNYADFYKVGIAESGNHDNRNYEDDWAERYIGLEQKLENGRTNYDEDAVAQHAHKLKGKLLLAHGGMDDNVPPYHTYLVVDALVKANKDFDLLIFPNARHGFGESTNYMMRRRWDYFIQHLMGATPAVGYKIGELGN